MNDLDGATDLGEVYAYPATPGEFAARWNSWDEGRRQQWLNMAVEQSAAAHDCWMRHGPELGELARLRAEVRPA